MFPVVAGDKSEKGVLNLVDIKKLTKQDVARMMDYSILQPEFQDKHQLEGCENVKKYKFGAFYVLPYWIPLVVKEVGEFCKQNGVEIGTGIAFPYGTATTKSKLNETEEMIELGCTALDMVANIGALKDKKYDFYSNEARKFVELCRSANVVSKIIIGVGYLTDEEIRAATKIVAEAGADYVKTATGTGPSGRPNLKDVKIMLDVLREMNSPTKLKVAGVVEPRVTGAYSFIRAGAARIGTRGAVEIVESLPMVQEMLF